MTAAPNPLDAALVALIAADVTPPPADPPDPQAPADPLAGLRFIDLCPGGANHLVAVEGVANPYLVFGLMGPTRDIYVLAGLAWSTATYGFDVIQEGHSAEQAQAAVARLQAILTQEALDPAGYRVMDCHRTGYQERLERTDGGVLYQHVQAVYTITISPE